jgi:hypothetical protein
MTPESSTNDVSLLVGCYYNHIEEVQEAHMLPYPALSDRVEIRIIKQFDFDGRRFWRLATVWLDGYPVMIIQNAGREGDDHSARFITDALRFREMCAHIAALMVHHVTALSEDTVDLNQEIEQLTSFYGNELNGPFERYRY